MWNELSLKEKADLIKAAVKLGIRDMSTIRNTYNEYAEGGKITNKQVANSGPKKSFDDWYKTVPIDRNDTTNYDLRRAYELAPIEELESWRTSSIKDLRNGKNHLRTVYEDPNTGIYNFVKSKNHPTVGLELDWYNSKDAADFRSKYDLDTSGDYNRYVPKPDYNIILPGVTIIGRKKAYGGDLGDPPIKQDTFSKSYKPPLPDQPIRFYPTVTEKRDAMPSSKSKDRQKFFEQASEKEKYEYRRKEAAQEKRNKELKNFMEGLNNTFGTAASLSALVYGGGWAANRLLLGNKASSVGQTLGKYMLPANTLDSYGDVAQFITDPSVSNALELGASIAGKKYNDYTKKGRQLYELGTQGLNAYNTFK